MTRSFLPPPAVAVCLVVTAVVAAIFFRVVDLTPHVEDAFFFSRNDPQLQADNAIDRMFPGPPQLVIGAAGDVRSPAYAERIRTLSDALAGVRGVSDVQSLSRGPKDVDDAFKSPLWSKLLIARNERSSYVYVSLDQKRVADAVRGVEAVRRRFDRPGFRVEISGVPYVTELFSRILARDLRVFSLMAACVFGVVLLVIFRSLWVLVGALIACANASALTLMFTQAVHIPIGPLTANLATMVFVMTLSPVVFLTFNWTRMRRHDDMAGLASVRKAVGETIVPSFWSAVCMFLGFISLMFVPSTPMHHLGVSGAIGATTAFGVAYAMYPWFLERATPRRPGRRAATASTSRLRAFSSRPHGRIAAALVIFTIVGAYGLERLNTDPDLPSYFHRGGDIRNGLDFMDSAGGSSPLRLVIEDSARAPLDTGDAYKRLNALQDALERDPDVGSVVSLAMLVGEAKRPFLSHFLTTGKLIEILESPKHDAVARDFLTPDHRETLIELRMREVTRTTSRAAVIARVRRIVGGQGFRTVRVGGAYSLLNEMGRLITSSIVSGIELLIAIFVTMGLALSRSLRVAAAMLVSLTVIPIVVRGYIAYLGMPLDFITASAANLDLGMGVDAMIYLAIAARRNRRGGHAGWAAWSAACAEFWRAIGTNLLVVCAGYSIFALSDFPPTQRFGLFVVFGSISAAASAFFLFPWLAGAAFSRDRHATGGDASS